MRISISNLAWDREEDAEVAQLLARHVIDAIDVAPTRYFPDPLRAGDAEVLEVRKWWEARGIGVVGMQALLYGTEGLNLFADAGSRRRMLEHLTAVCRIGGQLGARCLSFGSPRNRDRGTLSDEAALDIACEFFGSLGEIARAHAVTICLEPNPPRYASNFMTDSRSTLEVVDRVGHPHVRMQLDLGAMTINDEDGTALLPRIAAQVAHIHLSEPDLVPLGGGGTDHGAWGPLLHRWVPDRVAAIEMLPARDVPHLTAVERSIVVARRHYGG